MPLAPAPTHQKDSRIKHLLHISLLIAILTGAGCSSTISSSLSKYSYTELIPPSTLTPPGTIVTVIQEDPLIVGIICPASEAFGPNIASKLIESDSAKSREAKELTGNFSLNVAYLESISGKVDLNSIKTVNVELANVKVVELPDSAVFQLIKERPQHCVDAIAFRRSQGQKISMIKSVLKADATYKITFNSTLSAEAKAQITKEIAAALGFGTGVKSEDSFSGSGLFWGARDDQSLGNLTLGQAPPTGSSSRSRLLAPGTTAKFVLLSSEQP